jgi:hypothetical protein
MRWCSNGAPLRSAIIWLASSLRSSVAPAADGARGAVRRRSIYVA